MNCFECPVNGREVTIVITIIITDLTILSSGVQDYKYMGNTNSILP